MATTLRKPIAVWVLLADGSPWLFEKAQHLEAAFRTARTLSVAGRPERVWIAARLAPAHRMRSRRS